MLIRIRWLLRDLFRPGGPRRHPVLLAVGGLLLVLVLVGLALRPL